MYGQIYNDTRSMIFVLSGLSNTPTEHKQHPQEEEMNYRTCVRSHCFDTSS